MIFFAKNQGIMRGRTNNKDANGAAAQGAAAQATQRVAAKARALCW